MSISVFHSPCTFLPLLGPWPFFLCQGWGSEGRHNSDSCRRSLPKERRCRDWESWTPNIRSLLGPHSNVRLAGISLGCAQIKLNKTIINDCLHIAQRKKKLSTQTTSSILFWIFKSCSPKGLLSREGSIRNKRGQRPGLPHLSTCVCYSLPKWLLFRCISPNYFLKEFRVP